MAFIVSRDVQNLIDSLNITVEQAIELEAYDKGTVIQKQDTDVKKTVVTKKQGIQVDELVKMKEILKISFINEKEFKNKDLGALQEELGINQRQTPSRLKRLVEEGFLEDLGGSPKSYKVK